jgi:hypothetical protein
MTRSRRRCVRSVTDPSNLASSVGLSRRIAVRVGANVFEHRNDSGELCAVLISVLDITSSVGLGDELEPVALHVV